MRNKNKNRFGSIVLKSFIILAVIMMLLSVMPSETGYEEKFYMHKIHSMQKGEYNEYPEY